MFLKRRSCASNPSGKWTEYLKFSVKFVLDRGQLYLFLTSVDGGRTEGEVIGPQSVT